MRIFKAPDEPSAGIPRVEALSLWRRAIWLLADWSLEVVAWFARLLSESHAWSAAAISASAQAPIMEREVARLQAGAARRGLPWLEGQIAAKRKKRRTWSGGRSARRAKNLRGNGHGAVMLLGQPWSSLLVVAQKVYTFFWLVTGQER